MSAFKIAGFATFAVILSWAFGAVGQDRAAAPVPPNSPLEFAGTVYDYETKQPLEGAYVVASYHILRSDLSGSTTWCVRTRGMYTGADGKYWLPVEKRDGRSPRNASAIKPGYAWKKSTQFDDDVWGRQDKEAYSGHDIFLIRQDEKKPNFQFGQGDETCWHAETAEDAAAGVQFLKIELEETKRYGARAQSIEALREIIGGLERGRGPVDR